MGTLHKELCTFMNIPCWILLSMRNVTDKSSRQNQNTHFMFKNVFSRKSCRLWDNVEQYGRAVEATDDNTIQWMLFACWISKHIARICNKYCFPPAKIITPAHHHTVTLHVHCLSFRLYNCLFPVCFYRELPVWYQFRLWNIKMILRVRMFNFPKL